MNPLGKLYALVILNPDVPSVATNRMPYLVGLHINFEGDDLVATSGIRVMEYFDPVPDGPNNGPGKIYYLLYEQAYTLHLADTNVFTHLSVCNFPGR